MYGQIDKYMRNETESKKNENYNSIPAFKVQFKKLKRTNKVFIHWEEKNDGFTKISFKCIGQPNGLEIR